MIENSRLGCAAESEQVDVAGIGRQGSAERRDAIVGLLTIGDRTGHLIGLWAGWGPSALAERRRVGEKPATIRARRVSVRSRKAAIRVAAARARRIP